MTTSKGQKLSEFEIEKILGKPIKPDIKSRKALGSTSFFLKKFESHTKKSSLKENHKCAFQKYEQGLLARVFHSGNVENLIFRFDSVSQVLLIKGKEIIDPKWYSPMAWLLKLGVPLRLARYFTVNSTDYSINEMTLIIKSEDHLLEMTTNGWFYEGQRRFFEPLFSKEVFKEIHL
ncbi:hypothetical protein [Roseivirga thermotolerans]|jgi:hypothetical protein|uniref:Uncharacterized protein n=1 Tax=Roseivirga thermotolerans TaxID=1758176 RepID=A0ABQ3I4K0_9BACT|nr:hypothetical protein [Roseivirga thermotolerans]GHE53739.1 hypothetical protein GCM10011340_05310 [Roseivirga thermotolerans]